MAMPTLEDILRDRISELESELKQYRDTGFTPEEVNELLIKWQGHELHKHIKELLDAEKQGLLKRLPIPLGTTVWIIR